MFAFRRILGTRLDIARNMSCTMGSLCTSPFSGAMFHLQCCATLWSCDYHPSDNKYCLDSCTLCMYIMHVVDSLQLIFNSVNGQSTQVAKTHSAELATLCIHVYREMWFKGCYFIHLYMFLVFRHC